jgi:hypothetical protein
MDASAFLAVDIMIMINDFAEQAQPLLRFFQGYALPASSSTACRRARASRNCTR